MRVFHLGRHELRVVDVDPLLVYIRFTGDLAIEEARALPPLVRRALDGRSSRFLVQAAGLGSICPDSRRELVTGAAESLPRAEQLLDVVLVGASLLHKVVLSQIVTAVSIASESGGQTHFFDALDDALRWLGLPASLLPDIAYQGVP